MTLHFVYVKGSRKSTPDAIANETAVRLSKYYDIKRYDWAERGTIMPRRGDILLGLPHHENDTVFRNSFWSENWAKRIVLSPIHHSMWWYNAHIDPYVEHLDAFLAISGKYWIDTWNDSMLSHWWPWITHVDLAVSQQDFPPLIATFNAPGTRKFLYIGHTMEYKGCDYLSQLAEANPHLQIGWIGSGHMAAANIIAHGYQDLSSAEGRALVAQYDFLLTCGRSDANPTTILEAASWGLIPVCTPQSGYHDEDWFFNIPLYRLEEASRILNELNLSPDEHLCTMQQNARKALNEHYCWDRFANQILECLQAPKTMRSYNTSDSKYIMNRRFLGEVNGSSLQNQMNFSVAKTVRRYASAIKRRVISGLRRS